MVITRLKVIVQNIFPDNYVLVDAGNIWVNKQFPVANKSYCNSVHSISMHRSFARLKKARLENNIELAVPNGEFC